MPSFTDKSGRSWPVDLTVWHLPRLRELGFELGKIMVEPDKLGDLLLADPEKLVAALWLTCEPDKVNVSPDEFAAGFNGPALEAGCRALIEAAIDFFPRSRVATAMKGRLTAALEQADAKMIELLTTPSSGPVTNSPGSSV